MGQVSSNRLKDRRTELLSKLLLRVVAEPGVLLAKPKVQDSTMML